MPDLEQRHNERDAAFKAAQEKRKSVDLLARCCTVVRTQLDNSGIIAAATIKSTINLNAATELMERIQSNDLAFEDPNINRHVAQIVFDHARRCQALFGPDSLDIPRNY